MSVGAGMKPHDIRLQRGVKRRKRNHKIKCLKCLQVFLSYDLKSNRICNRCKQSPEWKSGENDHLVEIDGN